MTGTRIFKVIAVVAVGLVVAGVAAALGPGDHVICGRGHALNRLAQALMERLGAGHIDGPAANYCAVPSTIGWLMAAATFLIVVAIGTAAVYRRSASRGATV